MTSFIIHFVFLCGVLASIAHSYSLDESTGKNLRTADMNAVTVGSSNPQGVDISQQLTSDSAECMASNGLQFIVPRGYCSSCKVDSAVCNSLKTAANAGIPTRDVYMFPSPTCSKSAHDQLGDLLNYLKSNCNSQWSGRVWLDIEGSQYWLGDTSKNRQWYEDLVNACGNYGVKCGVYASKSQWESIFGSSSYCFGSNNPLWYAHYDNNPSFSDYSTFGCWENPTIKQYQGTTTYCSFSVDLDYGPNY